MFMKFPNGLMQANTGGVGGRGGLFWDNVVQV